MHINELNNYVFVHMHNNTYVMPLKHKITITTMTYPSIGKLFLGLNL
jgi:hypothetical protein